MRLILSIKRINFVLQSTFNHKTNTMSKSIITNSITIAFIFFISIIIFLANTGGDLGLLVLIHKIPMGDKLAHMLVVGTLAFLVNLSLKAQTFNFLNFQTLVGSAIIFCSITVEECSQMWIVHRNFDLLDLTFNYIGVFIASWIILKFYHK